jgi:hypothetical protein
MSSTNSLSRHSGAGRNLTSQTSRIADKLVVPRCGEFLIDWITACAGMTGLGIL